jgi:hypothetical protein
VDYLQPVQRELKKQISMLQDLIDYKFHENEKWIREKIRSRWLLGKLPDGSSIAKYSITSSYEVNQKAGYDRYYIFKNDLSSIAGLGNVDLTLTGSLGKGIKLRSENDVFEIFSTDEKYEEITERYGDYNFNITEEERIFLFDKIYNTVLTDVMEKSYALL